MSDSTERFVMFLVLIAFIFFMIVMQDRHNNTHFADIQSQLTAYQDSVNVLIQENIRLNEMQFELSESIITAMGFKPIPMVYAVEVEYGKD